MALRPEQTAAGWRVYDPEDPEIDVIRPDRLEALEAAQSLIRKKEDNKLALEEKRKKLQTQEASDKLAPLLRTIRRRILLRLRAESPGSIVRRRTLFKYKKILDSDAFRVFCMRIIMEKPLDVIDANRSSRLRRATCSTDQEEEISFGLMMRLCNFLNDDENKETDWRFLYRERTAIAARKSELMELLHLNFEELASLWGKGVLLTANRKDGSDESHLKRMQANIAKVCPEKRKAFQSALKIFSETPSPGQLEKFSSTRGGRGGGEGVFRATATRFVAAYIPMHWSRRAPLISDLLALVGIHTTPQQVARTSVATELDSSMDE